MAGMNDNGLFDNTAMSDSVNQPPPLSEAEVRAVMNTPQNQYNQSSNRWFRKPSKCGVFVTALIMVVLAIIVFSPWAYRFVQMFVTSIGTSIAVVADGAPTYMGMFIQAIILFAIYVGLEFLSDDYKLSNMVCNS